MKIAVFYFLANLSNSFINCSKLRPKSYSLNLLRMSTFNTPNERPFVMDAFGLRQFNNPDYTGTQVNYDPIVFEDKINEYYSSGNYPLVDGYAPFCKHLFVPNFANIKCGYAKITDENKQYIQSGYEARKENELAVLIQWFDKIDVPPPDATYLDIILYRSYYT